MIEELIQSVWSNPALQNGMAGLERDWIRQELSISEFQAPEVDVSSARRYIEAAAILAFSHKADQKLAAYRIATYAFELFSDQMVGIAEAVRAILTRLGNFPAISTAKRVDESLATSPWEILAEEFERRAANEVSIGRSPVALTDFQKSLWGGLSSDKSLAISAPTSTGKSFIVQAFIAHKLASKTSFAACYIVPTRALITQVSADLQAAISSVESAGVEVITVPLDKEDPVPDLAVYVLTQERLQVVLNNHPKLAFDFVVVDEAHSIQDGDRGIILQSSIDEALQRRPSAQLLFVSPTVSNLEVFADMTGRFDIERQATDQVVVSQNFIDLKVVNAASGRVDVRVRRDGGLRDVGAISVGQTLSSRVECLVHIAHQLGAGKQSIVFADGQADAEKIAYQISELREASKGSGGSLQLNELAELAREAVHQKYLLSKTLENGVAFHYGNMPTILRAAIERAFSEGHIQYLVCTSTLLAGVNLPAKNLFLCKPKRRKSAPLQSVDFWNLAGRAGRLKREFQGNIFLIGYEEWEAKPLDGPRYTEITPAIKAALTDRTEELAQVMEDVGRKLELSDAGLETIFVRLLTDHKLGRVGTTLDRANMEINSAGRNRIESALSLAEMKVSLPAEVLAEAPTISPYRQQLLFERLFSSIRDGGSVAVESLLICHPREKGAFENYVRVLELCHGVLLERPGSGRQNRFLALMLLRWMRGVSISELIDSRMSYSKSGSINVHIRETLELVEQELRFNYVRVFGCYTTILREALRASNMNGYEASMPSIALFLEIGASDKTMISFISMGLSRLAANRLTNICPSKSMGIEESKAWLKRQDLEMLGFSSHIREEVARVLRRAIPVQSQR